MTRLSANRLLFGVLLVFSMPVWAHPGHDGQAAGFADGLLHPLLGADHLLAMTIVGVWAAQLGGAARGWVPATFVSLMAAGAALAMFGIALPRIEAGIAASLLVLGLLVATALRAPTILAMLVAGTFALFHGAAHGLELPAMARPWAFAAGLVATTAALHGAGLLLGQLALPRRPLIARAAGALGIAAGLAYAFA